MLSDMLKICCLRGVWCHVGFVLYCFGLQHNQFQTIGFGALSKVLLKSTVFDPIFPWNFFQLEMLKRFFPVNLDVACVL